MILALLVFKLQLTSHPDGGHFVFCQYGVPMRRLKNPNNIMTWATSGPNLLLLEESEPKYP